MGSHLYLTGSLEQRDRSEELGAGKRELELFARFD